jgi:maleylacetoacetate isomerase
MKLYSYWRSSASYRVRIALALKGIDYDTASVNLLEGEQKSDAYARINPQRKVPSLDIGGDILTQSLAIIEYLDETHPNPPLLPKDPAERAHVRALALAVACEIAPLNNTGPLRYLTDTLKIDTAAKDTWYHHWIAEGFAALEQMLAATAGTFCHGDAPTMADCFLVPQVYNARRYKFDVTPYKLISKIDAACAGHPAFQKALPENQAEKPTA